jgi:tRNA pseudouridine55 synthase
MPAIPTPTARPRPQKTTLTEQSGLVVVDKPSGWTSHQVVARCRRLYGTRKVGHAGTLDPLATGVLLVGINRATRLLGHLAAHDKSYSATIRLGQATITDDAEGEFISASGADGVEADRIRAVLATLTGTISQVPSSVSAIKVDGKRSYARVRAGESVELAAREVTVSRFDLLGVTAVPSDGLALLDLEVVVDCTSGTYIRALARDLGAALGCGGHLTRLRRTRVGNFDLSLAGLDEAALAGSEPGPLLSMTEVARRAFPVIELDPAQASDVHYGRSLALELAESPTALLFEGDFLALYRGEGDLARPVAVLG